MRHTLLLGCCYLPGILVVVLRPVVADSVPLASVSDASSRKAASDSVIAVQRTFVRTSLTQLLSMPTMAAASLRYHPATFPSSVRVLNMTVFCDDLDPTDSLEFYAQPTWRCNNIRVGKHRLPFCESTPRALNEQALGSHLGLPSRHRAPEFCGQLAERKANLPLLCGLMLKRLLSNSQSDWTGRSSMPLEFASAVRIPHGNCSYPERRRISLIGLDQTDAAWRTEEHCHPGFVTDLVCSFDALQLQLDSDSRDNTYGSNGLK